jgi:hypothetical protein
MGGHMVEFIATGAPRALARAIEEQAKGWGSVSVLLVPWESTDLALSMAVTLVKADGWAIEHTNLATLTLTDLGHDLTRVAMVPHPTADLEQEPMTPLLDEFGRRLKGRFEASPGGQTRPS